MRLHDDEYAFLASPVFADDWPMDPYELLDVGDGARLERFGDRIVDRPHPAILTPRSDPDAWRTADLVYDRARGWEGPEAGSPWPVSIEGLTLELRPTDAGQVGLFPEQAPSWRWLRERVREREAPSVLNLFAYTGASTLALADEAAAVAHVDASKPTVAWARRNAELSGLADRPIRWLVDDAVAFVTRERRRGRRYDGVVLDPPSYGHGAGGRTWRLDAGLEPLLEACADLVGGSAGFVLLTAHTAGWTADRLADALAETFGLMPSDIEAGELAVTARSGPTLELGAYARWAGG
jgi:23S rRNA (cytosine1962-C5)-methyltransferase